MPPASWYALVSKWFTENSVPGCSNPLQTRHVSVRPDVRDSNRVRTWPEEVDAICPMFPPLVLRGTTAAGLSGLAVFGLSGCATKPPASDPDALADYEQTNDPLEPTNRVFYAINNGLDTVILRPAALAYRYVVPGRCATASITCCPTSARRCSSPTTSWRASPAAPATRRCAS